MKRRATALVFVTAGLLAGCVASEASVDTARQGLSAAQCDYFQVGGRVTICHATGSARHPFALLRVAETACVNAHAEHAGDRVALDGDCGPDACLPVGAPVDATMPCCDGLTNRDGLCAAIDRCAGVVCTTSPGHEPSECDPLSGTCTFGDVLGSGGGEAEEP